MTDKTEAQPEAMRVAAWLINAPFKTTHGDMLIGGRELRRQHAEIEQLKARLSQAQAVPLIARQLGEWHEDDGPVMWWAWNGSEWAGEPAWCGTPLSSDWPGYHTHWTPHPNVPAAHGIGAIHD
jgi:hypothetical protein